MYDDTGFITMIVIATVAITIMAFRSETFLRRMLLDLDAVRHRNEWWRLLTSGFVHADWMHLAFNMFTLWSIGGLLERVLSLWVLVLVYFGGIVIGSMVALVMRRDEWQYHALGASGGVSAVVGALTAIAPDLPMQVFLVPLPMPAWVLGSIYLVYTIVGLGGRYHDNIGHEAHLGGTAAGVLVILAWAPALAVHNALPLGIMALASFVAWQFAQRRRLH